MTLAIGSFCTGYGGLDRAVRAVFGGELAWWADVEPGPIAVMERHHPGVPNVHDIKTAAALYAHLPCVDVLTAGYPCQPFSNAGLRLGTEDPRHLWPYIAEAVGALRPGIVVLENVAAHLRRGFDAVLADLSDLGYDAIWTVVRASDVGAPHQRKRLFVIATDSGRESGQPGQRAFAGGAGSRGHGRVGQAAGPLDVAERSAGVVADPDRSALRHEPGRGIGSDRFDQAEPGHSGAASPDAPCDGRDEGRPEPAWLIGGSDVPECGAEIHESFVHAAANALRERREVASESDGEPVPGQAGEGGHDPDGRAGADFGPYQAAIERWAAILGRPAPDPTTTGQRGARVLSPLFVEWMMGLPAGHVTDTEGLSRNAMLKLLGNGVVPQQAEYALRQLVATSAAVDALVAA